MKKFRSPFAFHGDVDEFIKIVDLMADDFIAEERLRRATPTDNIRSVSALTATDRAGVPQAVFMHTVYAPPVQHAKSFVPQEVLGRQSFECLSIDHKPTLMLEHK